MKMSEFLNWVSGKIENRERQIEKEIELLNTYLRGYKDGMIEVKAYIVEQKEQEVKPEIKMQAKNDPESVDGKPKMGRPKKVDLEYSETLKARVRKMYLEENMTYGQIRQLLRVHDAFIASCISPEERRGRGGRISKLEAANEFHTS